MLTQPDNVYCSTPEKAPWLDQAIEGAGYLHRLDNWPIRLDECHASYARGHSCVWDNATPKNHTDDSFQCVSTRVSCSYGVAIYVVNCNTIKTVETDADFVSQRVLNILHDCCPADLGINCWTKEAATAKKAKVGGMWKHPTDEWYIDVRYTDGIGNPNC